MKPPNDVVSPVLEEFDGTRYRVWINPDRHAEICYVYWGPHGCARPSGHEGPHWCWCCSCEDHPDEDSGCVAGPPYYGETTLFHGVGLR